MRIDRRDKEDFIESLIRGVRMFGEAVFDESQRNVPVVTGNLKESAEFFEIKEGIHIIYHAPYAMIRENVVPKKTEQRFPRGTHYTLRAVKTELYKLAEYIIRGIQTSRVGGKTGRSYR